MKNDYTFKFVAAIIIAGVIVALVSPTHNATATTTTVTAATTATPEAPAAEHATQ